MPPSPLMARTPSVPSLPAPGEHDADGAVALLPGERAEEDVDRQAHPAAHRGRRAQVQCTVHQRHVPVRRDDVGAVGPHLHAILALDHVHARVPLHDLREDALVVGGQVLHQHERHARVVRGEGGEEGFDRRQATGRSADANDRKIGGARGGTGRSVFHGGRNRCLALGTPVPVILVRPWRGSLARGPATAGWVFVVLCHRGRCRPSGRGIRRSIYCTRRNARAVSAPRLEKVTIPPSRSSFGGV